MHHNRAFNHAVSIHGKPYNLTGLTPQARLVAQFMAKAGSITQREAIVEHSIQSLTRRITELKDEGIEVRVEFKKNPITKQRYARYFLVKPGYMNGAVLKDAACVEADIEPDDSLFALAA